MAAEPAYSETNAPVSPNRASDEEIIRESLAEFQHIATLETENRENGLDDLRFKIGEQWLEGDRNRRTAEQRPVLTINQLPQFIKEVVNDQRQRRPQIKILAGENGDPDTTKIYDGLVREIQYRSGADSIYDSSLECAVSNGFGYFRILTEYVDEKSFDQEIRMQRIRNPFTVYYGEHVNADGSDVKRVFVTSWMPEDEFKREYPDANCVSWESMSQGDQKRFDEWSRQGEIRVAERFCRHFVRKELWMLQKVGQVDGPRLLSIFSTEDIPTGYALKMDAKGKQLKRDTVVEEIWWYKLTAHDVLEKKKLDGKYIPIIPVWGEETDVEGRVYRSGLIRFAKDPMRSYNYWFTTATELIALAPKAPYIGAEGQFKGHEEKWRQANTVSYPFLEYVPKSIGGALAPPPARQPFAEMPQGVMNMILIAREDLRTTTGKYQRAELAPRGPEQSGSALLQERQKGELSSFNYVDNLARAIEFAGKVIVDLIPHVYDRDDRKVLIRKVDNQTEYVKINEADGTTSKRDVRRGGYNVHVEVGPGYSTRRQEGVAAKMEFLRLLPPPLQILITDLVARGMDWEDAERVADRLKTQLPPEIKAMEGENDLVLEELPPKAREAVLAARAQAAQAAKETQQYQAALQEAAKQLDDKGEILATDRYKADSAAGSKMAVAQLQAAVEVATSGLDKRIGEVMQTVGTLTGQFATVTSFIDDMRKREQALAKEAAAAQAQASAGPTPTAIRPEAAAGQAQPGVP